METGHGDETASRRDVVIRWVKRSLVGLVAAALIIQLIPYGRSHTNPPVLAEPVWDSAQTRELAVKDCFDCHSNETTWPWYSNIAPVSWLVQNHVDEGRQILNFSEWNGPQRSDEAVETVRERSMPPTSYLLTHPSARLTDAQLAALADGLAKTLGN
jgi:mono/diheme cytochrome c family protein